MSSKRVQTDPNKPIIVACPVSKCEVRHVAGVGVLLNLRYVEKAEQFETGERTSLQALIDPELAMEIGKALQKTMQVLELGTSLKKALKRAKTSTMLLSAPSPEMDAIPEAVSA
jgi:hypothetical protein